MVKRKSSLKSNRKSTGKGTKPIKVEKEYTILTPEEQQTRDAKYAMRLADLRTCLSFIDEAFLKVEELKHGEDVIEKWQNYLLCDGLPKPYIPPAVRLFFEKLKFFDRFNTEKTIDWLLSVDERSVLSQDIYGKDMTRRALIKEIRPNFGDEYKANIDLLLKVIKSIDYYGDDDTKTVKAPIRILRDILDQKKAAYQEIEHYFDHYAYRILSSEDSYMESVNATTAEYCYECDNFGIHIWTLKNVPILFRFLDVPCIEANLHKLKVKIILPYSILKENLTIRGIHFLFDPFSENAKSFKQDIKDVVEDLTAGIPDIHECLVHEHFLQVDLQNQVRTKLMERRAEYESKVHALNEQLEMLKKSKSADDDKKKEPKLIKLPKEPPIITDNTFPDIWEDFLQLENERYNNFINNIYNPDSLQLEHDEINLKKYSILGGIYQLYFVKKPIHYNFNDFTMTWHENNGDLEIIKDVIAEEVLPPASSRMSLRSSSSFVRTSAISRRSVARLTAAELSELFMPPPQNCDSPNFVITIELPEYLCLWGGEPLACHYEDDLVGYVTEKLSNVDIHRVNPSLPVDDQNKAMSKDRGSTTFTNPSVDLSYTPRQSSSNLSVRTKRSFSNIFRPSIASLVTSISPQQQMHPSVTSTMIEDFILDLPLSLVQIRNIQRYCVPRIISSFKFPVELQDEANEEQRGKPKKGGILLRKRVSEDSEQLEAVKEFQYDGQNNPERIFPILPRLEKIHMEYVIHDKDTDTITLSGTKYPVSFSDLVHTLDQIKASYQSGYKHTLQVPDRKMNTILFKDHKKKMKTIRSEESFSKTPTVSQSSASIQTSRHKSMKRKTRWSDLDILKGKGDKERLRSDVSVKPEMEKEMEKEIDKEEEEEEKEEEELSKEAEEAPEPENEVKQKTFQYAHWTTKYINRTQYEKDKHKITIWTDRLGTIGLAYKLYEHFPFKDWRVEPDMENEGEVIFTLETQYVRCVLNISAQGYRGYVTEPTKGYVRHRKIYMDIKEPITDFKELKKRFHDRFLNIFSNHDARFYIENGYFSEKHLACELHTYSCIALHCLMLKYTRSDWNRLANRRDIILNFGHCRDPPENMMQVHITPENSTFVEIKELCSDNLDVFLLDYTLTWRNIDNYCDFHHLIMSAFVSAIDNRCKDPKLMVNVKNLLYEIRPLSYS
ncbi:uncharacterized protein LOC105210257 [Zeugodacus cucurbitae]|uniref:uncharacterized protein LOC105210257 n=1 Tax=Zeugodacus cucurbitae TaxID=28588 RepID=UPI0005969A59|nr:uncharacterized protein LOC105210257 [Zeugodacus cucurbitae]